MHFVYFCSRHIYFEIRFANSNKFLISLYQNILRIQVYIVIFTSRSLVPHFSFYFFIHLLYEIKVSIILISI